MKEKMMLFCVVLCICFATVLGRVGIHTAMALTEGTAEVPGQPVFIVDPGHGGFDGGAVGVGGVVEKDINLQIAQYVYQMLQVGGFDVVMSRSEDGALDDVVTESLRSRKRRDIKARARLVEDIENSVLLSIHQNQFFDASCYGAQVFYGQNHPESIALAQVMQETLRAQLDPNNSRVEKPVTESVYLVHTAKHPALLVECGFLSNPEEAKKLQQPEYQQKIAFAIYCAAAQWAEERPQW